MVIFFHLNYLFLLDKYVFQFEEMWIRSSTKVLFFDKFPTKAGRKLNHTIHKIEWHRFKRKWSNHTCLKYLLRHASHTHEKPIETLTARFECVAKNIMM